MDKVLPFESFSRPSLILEKETIPFLQSGLNPSFWTEKKGKDGKNVWVFDQRIRKKLLNIANDFFDKFSEILKKRSLIDVQLTGSLASYNYSPHSDLDVNLIVNLSGVDDRNPEILKTALNSVRFIWNLTHDISIRGYELEMYIQDKNEDDPSLGIFSLTNNDWVKKPSSDSPSVDETSISRKFETYAYEIEQLETRLLMLSSTPTNAKQLYQRAEVLKKKITKMRKEGLSDSGEFSIGNLAYKKLRNEGYIDKLVNIIAKSYDKIYTE